MGIRAGEKEGWSGPEPRKQEKRLRLKGRERWRKPGADSDFARGGAEAQVGRERSTNRPGRGEHGLDVSSDERNQFVDLIRFVPHVHGKHTCCKLVQCVFIYLVNYLMKKVFLRMHIVCE